MSKQTLDLYFYIDFFLLQYQQQDVSFLLWGIWIYFEVRAYPIERVSNFIPSVFFYFYPLLIFCGKLPHLCAMVLFI